MVMQKGDWPEFFISILFLGYSANNSGFPRLFCICCVSAAIAAAIKLPPPNQRFRYMWRLTYLVWCLILLYSAATSHYTKCHWSLIPVAYASALLVFYGWHVLAHQRWTGRMHKVHMYHHQTLYPPENFLGEKHEKSHEWLSMDAVFHEGPLYAGIAIELAVLNMLYGKLFHNPISIGAFGFLAAGLFLFGTLGNALHYAFHIKGHWLESSPAFLMLRELHWIHHKGGMKQNYMLLNFSMDELFSTKDFNRPINETLAGTAKLR